jgi:predicted AAA+ superfamily ATPase
MHPFSVRELAQTTVPEKMFSPPQKVSEEDFDALWTHGGFPEPFDKRSAAFSRRWRQSRRTQLLREDVRDLTRVQEVGQLEVLADMLEDRSAEQIKYAAFAELVRVSEDTIRRWVETLISLHYGFVIRPWFRNVTKSLRKEPKWYLRDWSGIQDVGKRAETFVACHLLKAVDAWNDMGLATCELHYLRDKEKREVDFLVVRDRKPWFLVEVKYADKNLQTSLRHFQEQTGAPHAFQVVVDQPYVAADCFERSLPVVVPARTFLSQLI